MGLIDVGNPHLTHSVLENRTHHDHSSLGITFFSTVSVRAYRATVVEGAIGAVSFNAAGSGLSQSASAYNAVAMRARTTERPRRRIWFAMRSE
jgi:hypothetical protein